MKVFVSFLFVFATLLSAKAQQRGNFNTSRNWSLNKKEFVFGGGASNFLGDLGGRNQIGTDFSPVDFDRQALSWNLQIGYRYRYKPKWATQTILRGGMVRGSDQFTQDLVRSSRNLSFRSPVISLEQRLELLLAVNEEVGGRYRIPGLNRRKDKSFQFYVFAGIGVAWFSPRAELNGTWYKLKPLTTEGQGLPGGPEEYRGLTFIIPSGIGIRTGLGKLWRIGLEISYIKTFTDYMDDVSGNYYDPETLRSLHGEEAAYFSNPAQKNQNYFAPGFQRGDEQLDAYMYGNLIIYRNLTYKPANYKFGRSRYKSRGRYKF